ncbi:Uncharacterised protein [Candidatus Venteria ishoeyi]|uniref:Uncharacterized protein n=3 Tax=Candidatus Venteria ishoeyi TaxID=1899563 RepID=A0A1H6FDP9_9GAMM|nr:Uncharacterised protein [Candidatus Venteria ishoeyi]
MIAAPELFGNQRPQMDDNGDGAYSSGDGVRAAQVLLGKEGNRAADAPEIIQVHERLNLSTPEGILWVKTSPSADKVRKVRLSLIPPDFVADNYAGDSTDFGRIVLEMGYNPVQDRFEAVYSAFHQAGAWSLLYEAQGLDGTWSEAVAGEVQATGITSPVTVRAILNQSVYSAGEQLRFDLSLNATDETAYDVYAAILFPGGYFVSIRYPYEFSLPDTIIPYQQAISANPPKTLSILDLQLPPGLRPGNYQVCGIVSHADSNPWDVAGWLSVNCQGFGMN